MSDKTDFWKVLNKQGNCKVERPVDMDEGWGYMLTGGEGFFALAWRDGNITRLCSNKGYSNARLERAIQNLPEGIIYWFGIYEDGIMVIDVLTEEELCHIDDSPIYAERLQRAEEIVDALQNDDLDLYPARLYPSPKELKAMADQYGLRIIGVKNVPYKERAWCMIYDGGK